MQRAYDNLIHDVALQNLHVVLCLDRSGLTGEDGATHHGVFDLAYLRPIPNLIISSPIDEWDLRNLMYTACKHASTPFVIRYPKGKGEKKYWRNEPQILPIGKGKKLRDGNDVAALSIGPIGNEVTKAIQTIETTASKPCSVAHYDMIYLKPLDEELLHEVGRQFKRIITVENGVRTGGLGSAVAEFMADNGYTPRIQRIGVGDAFVEHGAIPELYALCGMDAASIARAITEE
jgi:1-deoxy-D-xylulose-5-phosphate synthase